MPDQGVLPDDAVFRRVANDSPSMVVVDVLTGHRRPSTGAFKLDPDGISVYLRSVLSRSGLSASEVAVRPGNLVVELPVAAVVDVPPLTVRADPWPRDIPDATHPRNAAHALVVGWEGLSRAQRKERQDKLVNHPNLRWVYP